MKILFFQWDTYMNDGTKQALKRLKIEYDTYDYQFADREKDDAFLESFSRVLHAENHYELVLSINYSPLIAQVCHDRKVRYAAWIYDSPIHTAREEEMHFDTTHLFCFDRGQAARYQKKGIRAFHVPLAADPKLFLKQKITAKDRQLFQSQVSFLGQLYYTDYAYCCGLLKEYERGFLEGMINAQQKIYGAYLIPDLVTDDLLKRINEQYAAASDGQALITRRQLEYLLACEVTSRERYLALGLLSNHFKVKHYAPKADERLKKVQYMGYANYDIDMPKIFQLSDINLNISLKSIESGIPLRCLDIMACGGFLLSNYQEELAEYFRLGEEVVTYGDIEELLYLVDAYLKDEARRKQIARCGQERIRQDFTYERAVRSIVEQVLGEQL